jgi:Cu2+-exporting ATPase
LQYGNLFKVTLDSHITSDGIVILSTTKVDEFMMISEFLSVKKTSSSVIVSSLNSSDVIIVCLTHLLSNNIISMIATMIDEAKFSKLKTQELVNIIVSYFVSVILALTIITLQSELSLTSLCKIK